MPFYEAPDSPDEILFVLDETIGYCNAEIAATRPAPVKGDTIDGAFGFVTAYRPLVAARTTALANRVGEVNESVAAKKFLEETVRDYIEVLKRRTRRKRHNAEVLVKHGLPENGDTPYLGNWADLKTVAEKLIAGDAQSAAEYGAMSNPSAAEVATALATAKAEHDDVAPADTVLQIAQSALDAQLTDALFWVSEIRFDALDTARREDEAGKRRLLRKLGFKFKTLPGEPPEDPADEPAEPTPAPTP